MSVGSDREQSPALSLTTLYEFPNTPDPETSAEPMELTTTQSLSSKADSDCFRCRICNKKHPLRFCAQFKSMTVTKRLKMVMQYNYCSRCFAQSHRTSQCHSTATCAICQKDSHNTLLHDLPLKKGKHISRTKRSAAPRPQHSKTAPNTREQLSVSEASFSSNVLLPTCIVGVVIGSKRFQTRALLDPCSETSLVHATLAAQWRIPISTIGDHSFCELALVATHDTTIQLTVRTKVVNVLNLITPSRDLPKCIKDGLPNMILADPEFFIKSPVQLVLGANIYGQVIRPEIARFRGLPLAQSTLFGWVLSGPCIA